MRVAQRMQTSWHGLCLDRQLRQKVVACNSGAFALCDQKLHIPRWQHHRRGSVCCSLTRTARDAPRSSAAGLTGFADNRHAGGARRLLIVGSVRPEMPMIGMRPAGARQRADAARRLEAVDAGQA